MKRHTNVPSEAVQLSVLTQFLQEFWSAADLPPAETVTFELALEEIFMNVVMHGSPVGRVPHVEVSLALCDGCLTLMIEDDGPSFDPLSLAAPDVTASLEERRVGGLGVHLVRQMMDAVSYQRLGGRNQLSMTKRVREPTPCMNKYTDGQARE
jgi:anti-sigma regulatory factor (Ser/Thr protein kinase)